MQTDKSKQRQKPQAQRQPGHDQEHGEGNYKASREYNQATAEFVKSGRVDEAARKAKPSNPEEARELQQAEQAGRKESKGEDPGLYNDGRKPALPD
jgi:hypothetical protein